MLHNFTIWWHFLLSLILWFREYLVTLDSEPGSESRLTILSCEDKRGKKRYSPMINSRCPCPELERAYWDVFKCVSCVDFIFEFEAGWSFRGKVARQKSDHSVPRSEVFLPALNFTLVKVSIQLWWSASPLWIALIMSCCLLHNDSCRETPVVKYDLLSCRSLLVTPRYKTLLVTFRSFPWLPLDVCWHRRSLLIPVSCRFLTSQHNSDRKIWPKTLQSSRCK